jgi:glycosyltransferase involved in cell wall biosynthesis
VSGEVRPELAFVVQRFGADVTGGSESLARALAERLRAEYRVSVFTTCARDYVTWRNERPAGVQEEEGVIVRRFPVEEERDLASFNRFSEELYAASGRTREDELLWLRRQGPYVPALVDALRAERDHFAAVLFFTYLYYPTYWGLQSAADRSILVPTTHDEPPLAFGIFREVFSRARALAFLTPGEEALVRSRFEVAGRPAWVTGMGIDLPEPVSAGAQEAFRERYEVRRPYLLYAGRIDAGKGCAEMIEHYRRWRAREEAPADLLLIGRLAMELPDVPGLRYLGYLDDADKGAALAGAEVVLCPSPYESLSIVLLEGLAAGVPALVNARSPVLEEHCLRSGGGLFYQDGEEFAEALHRLWSDPGLRTALGQAGRRYVLESYRWEKVLARYRELIAAVAAADR